MADSGGFSGFRNIKPMTRDERRALKDKVALEKDRLMKRSGMAARMYRENAPGPDGLTCMESTAAGYLAGVCRVGAESQCIWKGWSGAGWYGVCSVGGYSRVL